MSNSGTTRDDQRPSFGAAIARAASRVRVDLPLVALDLVLVVASYTLVLVVRFEGRVPDVWWDNFAVFLVAACITHGTCMQLFGGYGRWWRHASIEEARSVLLAGVSSAFILFAAFSWGPQRMPLSLLLAGPLVATFLEGLVRFQSRLFAFRRKEEGATGLRAVVVGAGKTGANVVREMQQNQRLGFTAVAVLDDDASLHGRSLHDVPILGGISQLSEVIRERDVHLVLYTIRSSGPEVARRVADATNGSGVPVRVVREAGYWVHGAPLQHLRALTIEDLLGRVQVELDMAPVRSLVRGRRVLVTGGGGWIGSEIARQVSEYEPSALVLLDHDETHLFDAAHGIPGIESVLGDIRDRDGLNEVFSRVRPDVVFHAAAHKHVPILENYACEAVRTNVLGTANVVEAAARAGTPRLVCISTDKAAKPGSVMGASKWLAEQVVLARAPRGSSYCSVRFGNVLGSRGSVIPTFQRQIDAGGPVTVTDPDMTRFFMSTDEAVRLVMLAGARSVGPAVLALEMGEAVNIGDLAERMIRLSGHRVGHDIEIEITGARPGENLREEVVGPNEEATLSEDEGIMAITPSAVPRATLDATLTRLEALVADGDNDGARETLLALAAAGAGVHVA